MKCNTWESRKENAILSVYGKKLQATERQQITTACNMAGKVIYLTRNKVVHAKTNFAPTGHEIASEEMPELNNFMKEACSQAIRWYSRQPKHLRFDVSTKQKKGG